MQRTKITPEEIEEIQASTHLAEPLLDELERLRRGDGTDYDIRNRCEPHFQRLSALMGDIPRGGDPELLKMACDEIERLRETPKGP